MQSIFKKNPSVWLLTVYIFIMPFLKGMFYKHLFYLPFIVLLMLFIISIKKSRDILIEKRVLFLIAIQFVVQLSSLFTGINKEESFYGLMKGLFPVVFFFLISNLTGIKSETNLNVNSKNHQLNNQQVSINISIIEKILFAIFLSGTFISFFNYLVVTNVFNSSKAFIRFGAVIEYANTLAVFLFVSSSIGFYFSFKHSDSSLVKRVIIKTLILLNTSALILTYSRKMWILSFLIFSIMIVLYKNKRMLWDVILIMSLTVLFSAYISKTSWIIGRILMLFIIVIVVITLYEWLVEKAFNYMNTVQNSHKVYKKSLYKLMVPLIMIGIAICVSIFIKPQFIFSRINSISVNTPELQERFAYYRDSMKIIGNYPFTGVGCGGWASIQYQYQTSIYSVRFVHSSIIQAALDYGIAGLLIFVFQIYLFFSFCFKAMKNAERNTKALIISVLSANIAIVLHSLLDVDLEFPIISAIFWISMSIVAVLSRSVTISGCIPKTSGNITKLSEKNNIQRRFLYIAAIILALIQVPAFISSVYYNNGDKALDAKNYALADENFHMASIFIPFSSNAYYMRGKIAQHFYDETAADKLKSSCIKFYNQAQSFDKYNPRYTGGKVDIYNSSKDYENCFAELRKLIELQPLVIRYYELLSDTMIVKVEDEAQKGNLNNQKERLQEIIHLEDKIKASRNKFSKSEHTREFRESFKLTPLLSLNIAKAYFLSGKYDMVKKYLPVAAQDKNLLNAIYELNMGLQRVSVKK